MLNFSFSFRKMEPEIKELRHKLGKLSREQGFDPDVILGVTGEGLVGGCIIGAWLASPPFLNKPKRFYPTFRERELSDALKNLINQGHWRNILLVDDESRTGDTIKKELDELQRYFPDAKIKIAVIVVRRESWIRLGENFWRCHVFCHCDIAMDMDVTWPWDV